MADSRYTVVTVADFEKSAVNCPVQLHKYQIVYDAYADKTYLRIVFENYSYKPIASVSVKARCVGDDGKVVGTTAETALKTPCEKVFAEFGKESTIPIPNGTKSVEVDVLSVAFFDYSTWTNSDTTFVASISDKKPFTDIKYDEQLEEELQKRNMKARYLPVRDEKYWRCTCGQLNGIDVKNCVCCNANYAVLFNVFNEKNLENSRKKSIYEEAKGSLEQSDFVNSAKLFKQILDYKDSAKMLALSLEKLKEEIYTHAIDVLQKDDATVKECEEARDKLLTISDYVDASEQIDQLNEKIETIKQIETGEEEQKSNFDKVIKALVGGMLGIIVLVLILVFTLNK